MRYDGRLDTLRALAAISVIAFHFSAWCGWGWIGVPFFFVLSGYLITSILLESKERTATLAGFLGHFYLKRMLRLLPVYLLFIVLLLIYELSAHHPGRVLKDLPFLLSYTFNFEQLDRVRRDYGHLWSLSVEWQFYLFWPIVVWILSSKALQRSMVGIVCVAPLLRYLSVRWLASHGESYSVAAVSAYLLTWTQVDLLALGGLLAWRSPRELLGSKAFVRGLAAAVVGVGLTMSVLGWLHGYWGNHSVVSLIEFEFESLGFPIGLAHFRGYVWGYSLVGLLFASIVAAIASTTAVRGVFKWRWLTYLGRVSYGFYIFHAFAILLARQIEPTAWLGRWLPHLSPLVTFATAVAIAFVAAHLSFWLWESRFLNRSRASRSQGGAAALLTPPETGLHQIR